MKKILLTIFIVAATVCGQAQRQMEYLSRGLVAVPAGSDSVLVGWRLLATDDTHVAFNLYRSQNGLERVKLNNHPLASATSFLDTGLDTVSVYTYTVCAVAGGTDAELASTSLCLKDSGKPYWEIPLRTPDKYTPGDCSVGDLNGDGDYEIVVHMTGQGHDNGHNGFTDPPIFHAYKLDGTLLWSINLGKNIREGAHYTQFLVYDFDGDGRAEVVMKTSDGTIDGKGHVIGDATADHRNSQGHISKGAEYLTVFDGLTGQALQTVAFRPQRHPLGDNPSSLDMKKVWGDDHYNRSERYLACVAYLDGVHPSLVMCRGYYTRVTISAFDWRNGMLASRWDFDSDMPGNESYRGQGNHNLSVGDVDGDGCDEIIYGSAVIDHDGKGLYSTRLGHADAMHFSDLDPDRPGLEVFNIQERFDDAGLNFRDARSGEILWKVASVKAAEDGGDKGEGPGRGASFNIDPRFKGNECWAFGAGVSGMWDCKGNKVCDKTPRSCNFAVWWDGDLLRELLDRNTVYKWNWETESLDPIMVAQGCWSNNGTKSTPALSADLFGDWREEIVLRTTDNKALRIYSTTIPTSHRFVTLMHDPIYRLGVAWQNVAYNQPPHVSYYIGDDMNEPPEYDLKIIRTK
ncbi:MAG: rhamnogalacturonan lyase [Breznakibacter sp.]